ncbi:MAG: hypothetical protein IKU32_07865 [Clostridia bacterium]|nr:hypothetical protein [Clostridia bacterium]
MKAIKGTWYAAGFAAVMGFAAGMATELGGEYINDALSAMGLAEGITLLSLSITGILLNGALFCWCSVMKGNIGKVMSVAALWVKAVLIGLFCRALACNFSALKAVLGLLVLFGGGCVCLSYIMEREQIQDKAKRFAVWLCGVTVEGIMIPSVARTWVLLFG